MNAQTRLPPLLGVLEVGWPTVETIDEVPNVLEQEGGSVEYEPVQNNVTGISTRTYSKAHETVLEELTMLEHEQLSMNHVPFLKQGL